MSDRRTIHHLVYELIPLYADVEEPTKSIMDEHITNCTECKSELELLNEDMKEVSSFQEHDIKKGSPKPFRKLLMFKLSIFLLAFLARIAIISLIIFNWHSSFDKSFPILVSNTILFYFPYVSIVNVVTFIFYRKAWFWIQLTFDIIILMFLDDIIRLFI